jgi:chemotaxis protein histidine kinase CheA
MNLDCIEAIVSGQRIAVPVRSVERLAELEVRGPVPLAHAWVGGLGRSEADAVVTLALAPPGSIPDGSTRTTAALVLKERSGDARWAIEVDRVLGFRQLAVRPLPGGAARGFQCPREWLAGTGDDALVLVDTEAVWSGLGASGPTPVVTA